MSAATIEFENVPGSEIETAVGSCLGSLLIAKPNRKSCISGTPSIIAKVSRSRRRVRMSQTERLSKLNHLLHNDYCGRVRALRELEVSESTLRRDIAYLRDRARHAD